MNAGSTLQKVIEDPLHQILVASSEVHEESTKPQKAQKGMDLRGPDPLSSSHDLRVELGATRRVKAGSPGRLQTSLQLDQCRHLREVVSLVQASHCVCGQEPRTDETAEKHLAISPTTAPAVGLVMEFDGAYQ